MCGIAGEVSFKGLKCDIDNVKLMSSMVAHRGPDGDGLYFSSNCSVVIAHRRLAIIGLGEGGAQPMLTPCSQYVVSFNGEIYNYLEIKKQLLDYGVNFQGDSDTEVILQGYVHWGISIIDKLQGMFAISIFDKTSNKLILARDRVGIKPLFVKESNTGVVFCSELDPIKRLSKDSKIDINALTLFLKYRYISGASTIWSGIEKFPPGQIWSIDIDSGTIDKKIYWNLASLVDNTQELNTDKNFCKLLKNKINKTIGLHLQSDVPIGVLLSGGLDSSIITSTSANILNDKISTFSIGFGGDRSELPLAKIVSEKFNTKHFEWSIRSSTLEGALEKMSMHYGNPLADSSCIPYLELSEKVSKHVKVVIGGDGGDELFGGYKWYSAKRLIERLPKIPWLTRLESLSFLKPKIKLMIRALSVDGQERDDVLHGVSFNQNEVTGLLVGNHGKGILNNYINTKSSSLQFRQYDLLNYTVDSILYKVDVASMAYGLEVRVPFLDHKLLEFSLKIPQKLLYNFWKNKISLRDCYRFILPKKLWKAPKQGFSLPLRKWESEIIELSEKNLINGVAVQKGILNGQSIKKIIEKRTDRSVTQLWTLLVFEYWLRNRMEWI
jgi:asparagine synthase (glutamine-hydrolysing)